MKLRYHVIVALIICTVLFLIPMMILWTDSCLEYTLTEYKGEPVEVNIFVSTAVTLIASPFVLPFNIACEIHEEYVR